MLTLDLKSRFEELALRDHLLRMQTLMTELDPQQFYSAQADFPELVEHHVIQLKLLGIHSAYQQACVLFSILAGGIKVESLPAALDAQGQVAHCVSQSLQQGIARGAFQHIHRVLSGIGAFDQAWLEPEPDADCLSLLPPLSVQSSLLELNCTAEGPVFPHSQEHINTQATAFRTSSGFQHKVSADFTPLRLLAKVCQVTLPSDPWLLSPVPVVEHCELGVEQSGRFIPLQKIQLLDARQAELSFQQRHFDLPKTEKNNLEQALQGSALMSEGTVHVEPGFLEADLSFQSGWCKTPASFGYAMKGALQLSIPAGAIGWQVSLFHEGVLAHLNIQLPQACRIEWSLDEHLPVEQLPVGVPLLIRQQELALPVQLQSAVCVGQAVLNLGKPIAAELCLRLVASVHPESRRLNLILTLSHTPVQCEWQAVDVLNSWSSGRWCIIPGSEIMQWDLLHG